MDRRRIIATIEHALLERTALEPHQLAEEPHHGILFGHFAAAFNSGLLDVSAGSGYLGAQELRSALQALPSQLHEQPVGQELLSYWREWAYASQRRFMLDPEKTYRAVHSAPALKQ